MSGLLAEAGGLLPDVRCRAAIAYLRSTTAIRDRCGVIFTHGCKDQLSHFRVQLHQLERVADYVIGVMRNQYPDLQIPVHSRWQHFEAGGVSRLAQLQRRLSGLSAVERAMAKFDLVIISVLLDAGAGNRWQYCEPETRQVFRRSEGLAVASFQMFCKGAFSSTDQPWQADAQGLQNLTEATLATGLQVNAENCLVGMTGRWELLQQLGQVLLAAPQLFGEQNPRPGKLVDYLLKQSSNGQLSAETILSVVLEGLGGIWPGRVEIAGVNLGDVWSHPAIGGDDSSAGLVPFHKLSQWLSYSLLEPLQELGLEITGLDALTGLPEYRNGGLCIDLGLLQAKHSAVLEQPHSAGSEVIVEWRALTVILLDHIAFSVRSKLGVTTEELPLVKVLQGGTWSAGRQIAAQLRAGGVPPIQLESDGTVF